MYENVLANKQYWERFLEQLKVDYGTPRFKAEVVFDTLLLPEIVVELVSKALGKDSCEDFKFVVKEYPILNHRVDIGKANKRSFCIDYLLHSADKMYLVELKTDKVSVKREQLEKYRRLTEASEFSETYRDYVEIVKGNKKRYAQQAQRVEAAQEKFRDEAEIIYIVPDENAFLCKQGVKYISLRAALADMKNYSSLTQTFLQIWQIATTADASMDGFNQAI